MDLGKAAHLLHFDEMMKDNDFGETTSDEDYEAEIVGLGDQGRTESGLGSDGDERASPSAFGMKTIPISIIYDRNPDKFRNLLYEPPDTVGGLTGT